MSELLPEFLDDIIALRTTIDVGDASDPKLENSVMRIIAALNSFGECVRYLNTRRSKGAILQLSSEADVQDALYLMLRPWVLDLTPENPNEKIANTFAIKDFLSKANHCVIEAKFIRNKEHGKSIVSELNNDIENYRYHPYCDDLIFFIYDPDSLIPDSSALAAHITSARTYGSKILRCHAVIKP
jgi:hypothetical protein